MFYFTLLYYVLILGLARLGTRYAVRSVHRTGGAPWGWGSQRPGQQNNSNTVRVRGRHLLDHEALTCLLVLLFVDEPKINTNRLHRVLRNLCYHAQTRSWVVRALLSIMQRTSECKNIDEDRTKTVDKTKRKSSLPAVQVEGGGSNVPYYYTDTKGQQQSWLSISLDAALGCRANVFHVQRSGKKSGASGHGQVTIHPQASMVVCRHVLDTLISLAKSFPSQFLPSCKAKEVKCDVTDANKDTKSKSGAVTESKSATKTESKTEVKDSAKHENEFWDILLKLDHTSGSRSKGKSLQRTHSAPLSESDGESFNIDMSPLGQLLAMLSHPVVRRSQLLTDRLLRLLGLVSVGLPEAMQRVNAVPTTCTTTTTGNQTFFKI